MRSIFKVFMISIVSMVSWTISISLSTSIILFFLSIFRTFTFMRSRTIGIATLTTSMSARCFMTAPVLFFSFFGSRSTFFAWPRSFARVSLSGLLSYFIIIFLLSFRLDWRGWSRLNTILLFFSFILVLSRL
jgi:hypothetical protein